MPSVSIHEQFLIDLVSAGDNTLPGRVLQKLLTPSLELKYNRDDHPYHGIDNAWIRVVSRGNTAYRVIYIKTRTGVLLYRAGVHSVEDRLAPPRVTEPVPIVSNEIVERAMQPLGIAAETQRLPAVRGTVEQQEASRYLKNHESRRLFENLIGRRLIPHREVYLVSPYLSLDLLRPTTVFGQMLDGWLADGCSVTLISRPPALNEIEEFNYLERRGFSIIYVERLHAKAYIFKVDRNKLNQWQQQDKSDLAVLGSANLTNSGFHPRGERDRDPQLEMSYRVHDSDYEELDTFVAYLAAVGVSHDVLRHRVTDIGANR
jgi:hypothetical protein